MQTKPLRLALTPLVGALWLAGCAGYPEMEKAVDTNVDRTIREVEAAKSRHPVYNPDQAKQTYVRKVNKPFLGAQSVPKASSEKLPRNFDRVTINQPGSYNIQQAVQLITEATGIPVTLSEDVNLPALNDQQTPQAAVANQQMQSLQASAFLARNYPVNFGFTDVPLATVLDSVGSAAGGLSWDYNNGRINFYRYITKTFTLLAPTQDPTTNINIGTANQQPTGNTSGTTSGNTGSSNTSFATTLNSSMRAWDEAVAGIKSTLSPRGEVVVSKTAQTVTVTDGRRQVEKAEKLIEEWNRIYTRQIAVHIEVVSLTLKDESEFGVNWSLVVDRLNQMGTSGIVFSLISPTSITNTNAATAGVKVVKQVNGRMDYSTSQALLTALKTVGKVASRRSLDTIALNRRLTPVASIRNTSYIAQTTPATATAGGTGGIPGLTPGTVSYGFGISMIPQVLSDNSLILDFGVLQSDLIDLVTQTSGTGINQQTIELPDMIAQQLAQSVRLNTGDTIIISGLEQDTQQYSKRTLGKDIPPGAGGMFEGKTERQSLIVMITPVIDNSN